MLHPGPHRPRGPAGLDHEVWDDAMELAALVSAMALLMRIFFITKMVGL